MKLKGMYMINGGDPADISKDSLFEKYVRSESEDIYYKKRQSA